MNRSIEQALLSLLPTHNSSLPSALTESASSLLAQSRHRASTLKAEEEIARAYACAHLACDRLKTTLDLPPITPRPPIPPRIYKRLYTHLDNILPAAASTPSRAATSGTALGSNSRVRTPSSKLRDQQQQRLLNTSPLASKTKARDHPHPQTTTTTPTKDKSLSSLRNRTTTTTPQKPTPNANPTTLPPWIRPTLRHLLTNLGPARIGPVVASALESILPLPDAWVRANQVSVLAALYLFVWRGVTWPAGREVDRERYVRFRREVAACLGRAREEVDVPGGWEGWGEVEVRGFDVAAVRGERRGWFEMGWVAGVGDLVAREEEEEESREGEDVGSVEVVQVRKGDSMFQERYDYLGERKRKAYGEWREGMLKRIKALEAR